MSAFLLYVVTRACMALVALMCIDGLTGNALAADPWNVVAASFLLAIAELILEDSS